MWLYHVIQIHIIYVPNVLIFAQSVLPETQCLLEWKVFGLFFFLLSLSNTRWDWLPRPISKVVQGVSTWPFKHKSPLEHCLHRGIRTNKLKMTSLTAKDKDTVRTFWAKIASRKDEIGANALCRCV